VIALFFLKKVEFIEKKSRELAAVVVKIYLFGAIADGYIAAIGV